MIDHNGLSGSLPSEINQLSSLLRLHVYFNNLTGTLPREIASLKSLELLDIESNKLSGPLFISELFNITGTLQRFRASGNQFVGSIPTNISRFTKLREFWISDNNLSGSIPDSITTLTNLSELFLSGTLQY